MEAPSEVVLRVCRTCKSESDRLRSLYEETESLGQKTRVHEMLMACAAVQVEIRYIYIVIPVLPAVSQRKC